ncbi:hypothetical protein TRVL_01890 [Trypanosoma vivax]|nr:hypothetical protein TRVL_01890 [Trypanosoma vivax]
MDIFNRMKSAFSRVKGAVHRVTDEERAGASRSLAPSSTESVAAGLMKNSASSTLSVAAQGCLLGEGCGYSMTAGTTSSERPNDRERGASEPEQLQQGQQTTCSSDAFDTLRCSAESSMVNDDGFFSFLENVIAGKDPEMEQVKGQDSTSLGAGGGGEASVPTPASPRIVSVRGLASHLGDAMVLSPSSQVEKDTSSAARSLKDYELMAYLGRGAFAEVTLARHRQTRALYAIKKISKEKVRDENCVQCTFTERQLLASFKHPFLVKFHQSFQSQRYLYLVLDFAQGGDLYYFLETKPWLREMRRKLNKSISLSAPSDAEVSANRAGEASSSILSSPPPPSEPASVRLASDDNRVPVRLIAFCAVEVALVLEYLHKHGFVYRDLKPENVLMMRDGNIVLTDFGVAKYSGIRSASGSHGQRVGKGECISTFIGTTPYMSPEVLLGQAHDSRIDWWSFGCMLFEMAAGRRPFDADNRYAAVKCIVEQDVQIQPEDFLPTALEVETRMVQLRRQCERRRRHSASQRSDGPRGRQRGDDVEGGDRSARFCDTAPTPPDAIASGREQGAENTHSVQEAHISTVEGVLELSMALFARAHQLFLLHQRTRCLRRTPHSTGATLLKRSPKRAACYVTWLWLCCSARLKNGCVEPMFWSILFSLAHMLHPSCMANASRLILTRSTQGSRHQFYQTAMW